MTLAIAIAAQPPFLWALSRDLCSLRAAPSSFFLSLISITSGLSCWMWSHNMGLLFHWKDWNPLWECWYLSCYLMFPKLPRTVGVSSLESTNCSPARFLSFVSTRQYCISHSGPLCSFLHLARCSSLRWPWEPCWRWQSLKSLNDLWSESFCQPRIALDYFWVLTRMHVHAHTHTNKTYKQAKPKANKQ